MNIFSLRSSVPFSTCPTNINKPSNLTSCIGSFSKISTSSKSKFLYKTAIFLVRGTVIPAKTSPSPYSPLPVLKNLESCFALEDEESFKSSFLAMIYIFESG